jgi:HEAT repeat protein
VHIIKSNPIQLRNRGYIEDNDLLSYKKCTKKELIQLLKSKVSIERTIAARLLGNYKDEETMDSLIEALLIEKKLYTKIAITESISLCGEKASQPLIKYLGMVGSNQHKVLPDKPFNKNNYPLPRDIIARTICKIGVPALKQLKKCLYTGEYEQIIEAVDAIGFISYYNNNDECFDDIIELFSKHKNDNLMIWKLLRCLQAFPKEKSIELLREYSDSKIKQLKWESERSLKQIQRNV